MRGGERKKDLRTRLKTALEEEPSGNVNKIGNWEVESVTTEKKKKLP